MDFFLGIAGKREGPIPETEVRRRIVAGELQSNNLCWTEGWTDWRRLIDTFPDAFTAAMAQRMPAVPPSAGQSRAIDNTPKAKTSGLAIAGFILGLLSPLLWVFAALPSVVLGHVARAQIRNSNGRLRGSGLALAGLIIAYASLVFGVIGIVIAIRGPAKRAAQLPVDFAVSSERLGRIVEAGMRVAGQNGGRMPETFEELLDGGLDVALKDFLDLPYTREVETAGYILVPGLTTAMPPETIYVFEAVPRQGDRIGVAFLGGGVQTLPAGSKRILELMER